MVHSIYISCVWCSWKSSTNLTRWTTVHRTFNSWTKYRRRGSLYYLISIDSYRILHSNSQCTPSFITVQRYFSVSQNIPIPWTEIFKSSAVWAIAASEFGYGYGFYLILTTLPQYVVDVLEVDIAEVITNTSQWHADYTYCQAEDFFAKK